jgi:hypothetical protein
VSIVLGLGFWPAKYLTVGEISQKGGNPKGGLFCVMVFPLPGGGERNAEENGRTWGRERASDCRGKRVLDPRSGLVILRDEMPFGSLRGCSFRIVVCDWVARGWVRRAAHGVGLHPSLVAGWWCLVFGVLISGARGLPAMQFAEKSSVEPCEGDVFVKMQSRRLTPLGSRVE